MSKVYDYYGNCVGWSGSDVYSNCGLIHMINESVDITRRTFLKYANREQLGDLELQLGYEQHHSIGLTMAQDWHVSYFKSKLHDNLVYGFRYKGSEYVFA